MSDATARHGLPFIVPGQAQKEVFHNEALTLLDVGLHPAVEGAPGAAPPAMPLPGQCWIAGAGATGAWVGKDGQLAGWSEGGWRFLVPQTGMLAWNKAAGHWLHWTGTVWSSGELPATAIMIGGNQVIGQRRPAVPSPSGGTIIDVEARAAVAAIIATLMSHGLTE